MFCFLFVCFSFLYFFFPVLFVTLWVPGGQVLAVYGLHMMILCFTTVLYFNLCQSHAHAAEMTCMQFRHSGILKEWEHGPVTRVRGHVLPLEMMRTSGLLQRCVDLDKGKFWYEGITEQLLSLELLCLTDMMS